MRLRADDQRLCKVCVSFEAHDLILWSSTKGELQGMKVYFACSLCEQVYRASQIRRPERAFGRFKCEACPATVHEWDGAYEYLGWMHMPSWDLRGRRSL